MGPVGLNDLENVSIAIKEYRVYINIFKVWLLWEHQQFTQSVNGL